MLKHVSERLRGKNYMLEHVLERLDCPQTETKPFSDMLSGKIYVINPLRERLNDLAPEFDRFVRSEGGIAGSFPPVTEPGDHGVGADGVVMTRTSYRLTHRF
jgi:hypothetical protein